jgi:hypothetical protein
LAALIRQIRAKGDMKIRNRSLFFLMVLACLAGLLAGCTPRDPLQAAVKDIRPKLGLPNLPLRFVENTRMTNSPSGNLPVALYEDSEGRKYYVEPGSRLVVEIDARAILPAIPESAPALAVDDLRAMAWKMARDAIPDFEKLTADLKYEQGGKGRNMFFDWRGEMASGQTMPPFVQIALHDSGVLFAYYNTIQLAQP